MSRRTFSRNAFESGLASGAAATGDITVDSSVGLVAPLYMVIDADDLNLREYIKVTAVDLGTGLLTCAADRGLTGSVGGTGQVHAQGAKVRTVAVQQWLEDIFSDVEDLEQADIDHVAAPDPHPQYVTQAEGDGRYVELGGDTMTGPLVLSGDPGAVLGAATKQYADARETAANAYADSLDHDHATPIETHRLDAGAHHAKYTDGEAVAAVEAVPVLAQGNFTDANGEFSFGGVAANMHLRLERPGANFQWRFAITSPGGQLFLQSSPDGTTWTTVDTWIGI